MRGTSAGSRGHDSTRPRSWKLEGQMVPLEAEAAEIHTLRRRISDLDEENRRLGSPRMVIRRNLVPILATVAGWLVLFLGLKG